MTAEQAKAESTQRSLEDERRSLSMQSNMEREELERAKVKLTNITLDGIKKLLIPILSFLSLRLSEHITGGAEDSDEALR